MKSRVAVKLMQLVLAVSVSFWLAGAGCMWGCTNVAMGSTLSHQDSRQETQTVSAGHSCHSRAHDCCAKKSGAQTSSLTNQPSMLSIFGVAPQGMMRDCPLAVNASAATTKASSNATDPAQISLPELPNVKSTTQRSQLLSTPVEFLNRGPTYLRCCVFLI